MYWVFELQTLSFCLNIHGPKRPLYVMSYLSLSWQSFQITNMEFAEVKRRLEEKSIVLIDVRNPDEVEAMGKNSGLEPNSLAPIGRIVVAERRGFRCEIWFCKTAEECRNRHSLHWRWQGWKSSGLILYIKTFNALSTFDCCKQSLYSLYSPSLHPSIQEHGPTNIFFN